MPLASVRGEPAWWQTAQVGPLLVVLPAWSWQALQVDEKVDDDTPVCAASRYGTEWLAPPDQEKLVWDVPWQVSVQFWEAAL